MWYQMWHLTSSGPPWFFQPINQRIWTHTVPCSSNGYVQTLGALYTTQWYHILYIGQFVDRYVVRPAWEQRQRGHHADVFCVDSYVSVIYMWRETWTLHDAHLYIQCAYCTFCTNQTDTLWASSSFLHCSNIQYIITVLVMLSQIVLLSSPSSFPSLGCAALRSYCQTPSKPHSHSDNLGNFCTKWDN